MRIVDSKSKLSDIHDLRIGDVFYDNRNSNLGLFMKIYKDSPGSRWVSLSDGQSYSAIANFTTPFAEKVKAEIHVL